MQSIISRTHLLRSGSSLSQKSQQLTYLCKKNNHSTNSSTISTRGYCNNHSNKHDHEELEFQEDDHEYKIPTEDEIMSFVKDDTTILEEVQPDLYKEIDNKYSPELLKRFQDKLRLEKLISMTKERHVAGTLNLFEKLELQSKTYQEEALEVAELETQKLKLQNMNQTISQKELDSLKSQGEEIDEDINELNGDEDVEQKKPLFGMATQLGMEEEFERMCEMIESKPDFGLPHGLVTGYFKREWVNQSLEEEFEEGDRYTTLPLEQYLNERLHEGGSIVSRTQLAAAVQQVNFLFNERMQSLGVTMPPLKSIPADLHPVDASIPGSFLKYANTNSTVRGNEPHYVQIDDNYDYNQHQKLSMTAQEAEEYEQSEGVENSPDPEFDDAYAKWVRERFIYKHTILRQLNLAKTLEAVDNENVRLTISRSANSNPGSPVLENDDGIVIPLTDAEIDRAVTDRDGRIIAEEFLTDRDRYNYLMRKYKNGAQTLLTENEQRDRRRQAIDDKKREIDQHIQNSALNKHALEQGERAMAKREMDELLGAEVNIHKYKANLKLEAKREERRKQEVKEKSSHEYLHRQLHRMDQEGGLGNGPLLSPTTGKEITGSRKFPKCLLCYDFGWRVEPMNVPLLSIYLNAEGEILPRYITGNCLKHQKKLARNIKAAKHLGLFSYKSGTFTVYDPNVVPPTPQEELDYTKYYKGDYTAKEWMDGDTRLQWEDDEANEGLYAETEEETLLHKEALMLDLGISEAEAKDILAGKFEKNGQEVQEADITLDEVSQQSKQ